MRRPIGPVRALLNVLACLGLLGIAGSGAYQVAGRHWLVQETVPVRAQFASIGGIEPGARVFIQGIDAGTVDAIEAPSKAGEPVTLLLRIDAKLRPLLRADALARVATQGVVGARIVEITPGTPDAPPLAANAAIATEPPMELGELMVRARDSLERVEAVASAAEQGLAEITAIAASIRGGEGTLGRLVADDEAYQRLVRLTEQGERTLGDLDDNLNAVKQTWPISSYFNRRGYDDRERALYRPGSNRQSRSVAASDLFEPGRSILTLQGRRSLDELARWLEPRLIRDCEVVVASFGGEANDADLADILTQEQAESVRRYLVEEHGLDSAGWFRSRKVAAIGFGLTSPVAVPPPLGNPLGLPAQRVEVIVFSPTA